MQVEQLAVQDLGSKENRIWFRFQIRFVPKSRQNALGLRSNLWVACPTLSLLNAILAHSGAFTTKPVQSGLLIAEPMS